MFGLQASSRGTRVRVRDFESSAETYDRPWKPWQSCGDERVHSCRRCCVAMVRVGKVGLKWP